ncbi:gliding motility-associated peptidyl-prolyl isomerase GldI [uncultured Planktosalinus sp.]|uniref:gliding motility-associated peptidyl-prolyl isomerase GldI n=1 Tax=uncultured Planktosalinus sp. TaxID=1810935 RepID=UPI0030D95E8E
MNKYFKTILLFLLVFSACKTPEARRPVKTTSGSFIDASVAMNKKIIAADEKDILALIEKDTSREYYSSEQGFWYYYNNEIPSETEQAGFGDVVKYEYEIKDLNGNLIYTKEELGTQEYQMDKEELISGLREGLKLMKEGETATFLLPSHKAYGYYGDLKRIGANMPIITTVTILNIEQIN